MSTVLPASPAPWAFAAPWGASGYVTDLDGPVHWIEFAAPGGGPGPAGDATPVVFVHGLGGSHLNWCLIGPQLAAGRRAVALDLHGFGLTPGTRVTSTVQRNARLLDRFVREVTGTPVILAGNSMGGLISLLQASAAPDTVRGLVLVGPALPLPLPPRPPDRQVGNQFLMYALPGIGEYYVRAVQARRPPQLAVQQVIELCFADPSRADAAMMTASIALAAERQSQGPSEHAFLAASRSLMRVVGLRRRYWEMAASVRVPVLLIGGEADRLVPVAAIRQAAARNPRWETVILPGAGHTPQLEVPGKVVGMIRDWLGRHFTPAAGLRSRGGTGYAAALRS